MKILIDGPDQVLYQWDKGQRLLLHGADAGTRVDFARCDQNKAVSVYAYAESGTVFCEIPDTLLMEHNHLHGYVYEIDGDRGETVREFMIPVIRRPMPEDYVAPDEVLTWHELERRIKKIEDEGVPDDRIAQAVEDYLDENPVQPGGSVGTVEIVDVVDRPPGSPPTVTETEDSTPAARKYILGIPRGSKGVGIKNTVVLDSPDGYTSVTISYTDGSEDPLTIPHGKDYVLTPADKAEIAEMAAELVEVPEQDSSQNAALTTAQIAALDGMFKVCAFTKADVSAEYTAFKNAFGISDSGGEEEPDTPVEPDVPVTPEKTLTSISATYSGGSVPVGTAISALSGIVVTAHYSDGSMETVTGYTLSGAISEGENTITVTYQGETATFTVSGIVDDSGDTGEVKMLTYIESDGNQIIDTGVVPSFGHRYEFGLQTMADAKRYFVGADEYRSNDSGTPGFMRMQVFKTGIDIDFQGQIGQQTYAYNGGTPYYTQQIMHPVATYTENDDGTITQKLETFADEEHLNKPAGRDGEKIISADILTKKTMPTIPLYLFGINVSDKSVNKGKVFDSLIGKIAYFKVFDDTTGEKLHEFRAAKRGGEGGMYDVVNNVFCGNIGTGAFTFGEEVNA